VARAARRRRAIDRPATASFPCPRTRGVPRHAPHVDRRWRSARLVRFYPHGTSDFEASATRLLRALRPLGIPVRQSIFPATGDRRLGSARHRLLGCRSSIWPGTIPLRARIACDRIVHRMLSAYATLMALQLSSAQPQVGRLCASVVHATYVGRTGWGMQCSSSWRASPSAQWCRRILPILARSDTSSFASTARPLDFTERASPSLPSPPKIAPSCRGRRLWTCDLFVCVHPHPVHLVRCIG
jgi:hypothetical protein